jgi:hypothetical protein
LRGESVVGVRDAEADMKLDIVTAAESLLLAAWECAARRGWDMCSPDCSRASWLNVVAALVVQCNRVRRGRLEVQVVER